MATLDATLTVMSLAALLDSGDCECNAAETELTVDALADPRGSDCYPDTTLEFSVGGEVIASVGCWMLGCYHQGPNRRDNGQYIGDGWSFLTDEGDGQTSGKPYSSLSRDEREVVWALNGTGLDSLILPVCTIDQEDEIADGGDPLTMTLTRAIEIIDEAIADAYDTISVSCASDEDVAEAMQANRSDRDVEIEINGETITLGLYAGNDAGRPVYTHDGADIVWDDADDCVRAARKYLRMQLQEIIDGLDGTDDDLAESLASVNSDD